MNYIHRSPESRLTVLPSASADEIRTATVVIPTYNRSANLERLLDCLTRQEGEGLARVVVCDDGSNDETQEVARRWSDRLPLVYRHQPDQGFRAGQARNMGIEEAIGEIIIFLDDDVLVAPEFVAAHLKAHRRADFPCIALGYRRRTDQILSPLLRLDEIESCTPDCRERDLGAGAEHLAEHPTPWFFAYSCNLSVSRGPVQEMFDDHFRGWGMEDIEFAYRLARKNYHFRFVPEASVLHVNAPRPHDPFQCELRQIDSVYDSYLRNSVYFLRKYPDDALLNARIRDDLRWYVIDENGQWVKNGRANDPQDVIDAFQEGPALPVNGYNSTTAARRVDAATPRPGPKSANPNYRRELRELAVELSCFCNLKCEMCSVWEIRKHGVPLDLAKALLAEAYRMGARTFIPCGAESFVRKDFTEIVRHAESLGYESQEIVTNGLLLKESILEELQDCPSVALHISIDGPRDIHDALRGNGGYDRAVDAASRALRRGIRVGLSGVILRETLPRLTALVDLAVDLGVEEVSFQPFQTEISGPDKDIARFAFRPRDRDELCAGLDGLREYARLRGIRVYTEALFAYIPGYLIEGRRPIPPRGCFIPSKFLLVDWRGDVYPCFFMRDRAMGNVYRDALSSIWHGPAHDEMQSLALDSMCPGCLAACSDVETYNLPKAAIP
jgi:MoaA/NifB/PqqE/SkfB family radical SAM enzyme/glycosyltransferase involved in cell wall biosynthesis